MVARGVGVDLLAPNNGSFVCFVNVACRNVASWQLYLGDGSNALIVMAENSKKLC